MARARFHEVALAVGPTTATVRAYRAGGRLNVAVIAKATFAFKHDAEMPRVAPQPIFDADVHHGNHPARSIRFAGDLAPHLGRAEVLFTGHAHAVTGAPVQQLPVRLGLFDEGRVLLDKALVARDAAGFSKMPLVYERAYGGAGSQDNPLGIGADDKREPSLVDPADPKRTACFGPIGRSWPARRKLLGSTERRDLEGEIAEIPEGFDWSYFQTAPADQRIERLRGDEWIVMEGLHPERALLRTRLPGARGQARVHGLSASAGAEGQGLALVADTLRIDGDEQCCTVTWRASFPVANEAALAALRIHVGVELPGQPVAWPEHSPAVVVAAGLPLGAPALPKGDILANTEATLGLPGAGSGQATMAFSAMAFPAMATPAAAALPPAAAAQTLAFIPAPERPKRADDPLPFRPGEAVIAAVAQANPPPERVETGTVMAKLDASALAAVRGALPFERGAARAEPAPAFVPIPELVGPEAAPPLAIAPPLAAAPLPAAAPAIAVTPPPAIAEAPPPAAKAPEEPQKKAFSWAAEPPPAAAAPKAPPPPPPNVPAASAALKKGLYGKFGGKGLKE